MLEKSRAETGGGPAGRPTGRDRGLSALVRRHGLVSFYVLAYGLSWVAWLPYVLSQYGLGVLRIPVPGGGELVGQLVGGLPGAYLGPLGAAFVVTALSEGRPGLRRWAGRLLRFKVNWKYYALALLGVPALLVAGALLIPGAAAGLAIPPLAALLFYVPFLLLQVVTTGLAEEPGWRDFALVRHQRRQGPLLGTLVLGVLWAGWHLPLFLTHWGAWMGGLTPLAVLQFTAFCVAISVVVTWMFNRTQGSLPVVLLAHVSVNTFTSLLLFSVFTTLAPQAGFAAGLIGFGVAALVVLVATRGRLGYRPEEPQGEPQREPRGGATAGAA